MGSSDPSEAARYSGTDMGAKFTDHARTLVWGYVLGPFLAFLPSRWRATWFANRHFPWRGATIVSGILQFVMVPLIVIYFRAYQYFLIVANFTDPGTWIVFYFFFEGVGRSVAAATTGETPGTLLLVAPDRLLLFVRRKLASAPLPAIPDLVTRDDSRADWQLRIAACRAKRDWDVGRLLRYQERYYRIQSCLQEGGPRPFVFLLSALAAGVPSRSVILYSPEAPVSVSPALSPQKS
jgi:hypothetical protein